MNFKKKASLSKRYKRRNRHPRIGDKQLRRFSALMDSFGGIYFFYDNEQVQTVEQIRIKLRPFLKWLIRRYELFLLPCDPDYRSGFETYGYSSILKDLAYISDRWDCSFRVRWLINLLEPEYENTMR